MYYLDYHLHTAHSADCRAKMEQQIESALKKGVTELCFTEHLEYHFPGWRELDIDAYREHFQSCKMRYPEICLLFGAEAGISCPAEDIPRLKNEIRSSAFDFIIASVHTMDGLSLFDPALLHSRPFPDLCRGYVKTLTEQLQMTGAENYDCVGHVDFPLKSALHSGIHVPGFLYSYAPKELDELFRLILSHKKCLEINTSPWSLTGGVLPDASWLRRYAELGGSAVTIGSDSHRPENVGIRFFEAVRLAQSCGIKYLLRFRERRPYRIPITDCLPVGETET